MRNENSRRSSRALFAALGLSFVTATTACLSDSPATSSTGAAGAPGSAAGQAGAPTSSAGNAAGGQAGQGTAGGGSATAGAGGSGGGVAGSGPLGGAGGGAPEPDPLVDRDDTLALMKKVTDYYLALYGANMDNDWIRATFYTGVMATYRATKDTKYRDAAKHWGEANDWLLWNTHDDPRWADNQAAAQTYAELYLDDPVPGNAVMLTRIAEVMDEMVANPKAGRVEWWWCDSLFMAPPAFARVAKALNEPAYLTLMNGMWWDTTAYLQNPATDLYWRDKDYINTQIYWSRGNGWVVGGTARVLEYLPADFADRAKYEALLQDMAAALLPQQGADGFWRSNLLDAQAFPSVESSGTAFFAFGLAWGIHHGVLDRATYAPALQKAWTGLTTIALDDMGRIGYVQAVGKEPGPVNQADTRDYAPGAFLLLAEQLIEL